MALPISNAPRTKRFEAIIDSGATRCLFHADFASAIGLTLRSGTPEVTNGIGGPETVWLHDIALHIPGGPVNVRAAFKENLPIGGLLGMSGFFEHFNIRFDSNLRQCELERVYRT